MRLQIASLMLIAFPGILYAQTADGNRTDAIDIRGHYVGEAVTRFLRLEPDAREDVDVCRQNPIRSSCQSLLAAVDSGGRTEISTSVARDLDNPDQPESSMEFVLDGGKVVKLSMPVNDLSEILKKFGRPSRESVVPSQNASGAKWENHLSVWDVSGIYVSLYQDNNPAIEDHRPLLVMESPEEHVREDSGSHVQNVSSQ
jgi:hypothetical protein